MAVYIEHIRPHNPSGLKRYDDLSAAATGIARATHCPFAMVIADLRSRGRFYYGNGHWAVVTAKDMRERSAWAANAADRIEGGLDVTDLPD